MEFRQLAFFYMHGCAKECNEFEAVVQFHCSGMTETVEVL